MIRLSPFWHQRLQTAPAEGDTTIVQALETWPSWYRDQSPLGATGDYALDMLLADAFRALLYWPSLKERLNWIERELRRPLRGPTNEAYYTELRSWWLDLFEVEKVPALQLRSEARRTLCVSC